MDKTVGKFTTKLTSVLEGGHHIVVGVKLADGLTGLKGGVPLYRASDGYRPLPPDYSANKPIAVLLEDFEGTTAGAVANAAVHGKVRAGKVAFSDGTPATDALVADLRAAGIYALGDFLSSAGAPEIIGNISNKNVNAGDQLVLSLVAASPDDGVLSYQWYLNTTAANTGGTAISGATNAAYQVPTAATGTRYFYCVATNTLNGTTASVTSAVSTVVIA
jgi:hypothetical protein